jgi:hypothetical protein
MVKTPVNVSCCHLNKHNLINSLAAQVHESAGLSIVLIPSYRTKFLRCYRKPTRVSLYEAADLPMVDRLVREMLGAPGIEPQAQSLVETQDHAEAAGEVTNAAG